MDLFSNGYINFPGVSKEDAVKVLKRFGLIPPNISDGYLTLKDTDEGCQASYESWYRGDFIEDILDALAKEFHRKGIVISGLIEITGEEEGRYEIYEGKARYLSKEQCVIEDMTDEELITEARRRGFGIAKAEGSKEL